MDREELIAWTLKICDEAVEVDPVAANDVIKALTGGYEAFCPRGHSRERLRLANAAFLRIARMTY